MKTFKDLEFKHHSIGNGVQAVMTFKNKRGVSVVKLRGSYGYPNLYELVVLNKNGGLDYTTDITDDVLGDLTEEDVTNTIHKVEILD